MVKHMVRTWLLLHFSECEMSSLVRSNSVWNIIAVGKAFYKSTVQLQSFSPLSSWQNAGQPYREIQCWRSKESWSKGSWMTLCTEWSLKIGLQSPPQQWCTSFKRATPTTTRPHILIVPLPLGQVYSNHHSSIQNLVQPVLSVELVQIVFIIYLTRCSQDLY